MELAFVPISIHALREERDPCFWYASINRQISIHALREERDQVDRRTGKYYYLFQSTRSARSATRPEKALAR